MKCAINDKDLLLYAHGEINLAQGMRIAYHLSHCPACRQRQGQLLSASAAFASVVRGKSLPEWRGPAKRLLPYSLGSSLMAWPTAFVMVGVIVLAAGAVFSYAASAARVTPSSAMPVVAPCHENLAPTPTPHNCRSHVVRAKTSTLTGSKALTRP